MKALARVAGAAAAILIFVTAAGAVPGRAYVLWTGSKVYAHRADGAPLRTTNGGRSWRVVRELSDYGKVTFASPTRGWLAGLRSLRTVDGGSTWHRQPLPAPSGYRGRLVLLAAPLLRASGCPRRTVR